jgi:hypothetical protein
MSAINHFLDRLPTGFGRHNRRLVLPGRAVKVDCSDSGQAGAPAPLPNTSGRKRHRVVVGRGRSQRILPGRIGTPRLEFDAKPSRFGGPGTRFDD